jgi:predicted transport protein
LADLACLSSLRDGIKEEHLDQKVTFKAKNQFVSMGLSDAEEVLSLARKFHQKTIDVEAAAVGMIQSGEITLVHHITELFHKELPIPDQITAHYRARGGGRQ